MYGVTPERNGWRDEAISRRHRLWGISCSAVDLDFLLLEFNYQEPVALVEYKHIKARVAGIDSGRYMALRKLCDGFHKQGASGFVHAPIPCLIAIYDPETWVFRVLPLNQPAKRHYGHVSPDEWLTEYRFVKGLLKLRKSVLTSEDELSLKTLALQQTNEQD